MSDDDDDTTQPESAEHRGIGILLALVAMAALGFSLVSQRWLLSPGGGTGFGLRDSFVCYADGADSSVQRCDIESNLDFVADRAQLDDLREHVTAVFPICGWATCALIGVGLLGLLLTTIIAVARKRPQWPIAPTTIALAPVMLAMITGCVFVATKPGETSFVGVAIGFWVFGAGAVAAIIASLLLSRALRPADVDLTADAINPDDF